jgi:hypothetical protein
MLRVMSLYYGYSSHPYQNEYLGYFITAQAQLNVSEL